MDRFCNFRKLATTPSIESVNMIAMPASIRGGSSRSKQFGNAAISTIQQKTERTSSHFNPYWLAIVALIATASCLPFMRTMFVGIDEAVLLNGAERMLRGSRIYADFFEFLPPGGFVFTAIWFSLAGISVGSARSLAILTIVGIACFTYLACKQVSKNSPLSALLASLWVVMSQGIWTQVSHHWFTTLLSIVSAWATLTNIERQQRRWALIAGMAAGAAAMTTTHRGALIVLATMPAFLFHIRRSPKSLIAYVLGCSIVPIILIAHLVIQGAVVAAFNDVILFAATRYTAIQHVPFGFGWPSPLIYVFPLAGLLTLLVCTTEGRNCVADHVLWQSIALGLAGFAGCFPRPDIPHISFVTPLICPLLAYCATRLAQRWRSSWWRYRFMAAATTGAAIGFCVPPVIFLFQLIQEVSRAELVSSPRGDIVVFGVLADGGPELLSRIAATPATDEYFFYPAISKFAFLTAREQVSKYSVLIPGYTTPSQYNDACISVLQRASWVVIDRRWTDPDLLKQVFPAMLNAEPHEAKKFEQALVRGYQLSARYGVFELRHRSEDASERECVGILE